MTLTNEDRAFLISLGYEECDLPQIEDALHASRTTYNLDGEPLTRAQALQLLAERATWPVFPEAPFTSPRSKALKTGKLWVLIPINYSNRGAA